MGFEPTISAGERPQTDALDSAANGTGGKAYIELIHSNEVLLLTNTIPEDNRIVVLIPTF